jgi:glycosyltransferase involved in cell wall biosynthesis
VRLLTVGNLYPPHHFGGYEQVWRSAVAHLRGQGHEVRVLATAFRHPGVPDGDEPGVERALRWYWRDHEFPWIGPLARLRIERHNHGVLARELSALRPDAVAFFSMGGMSHSLIEAVRRRGVPIALFVHDEWLDYGRFTDQWLRIYHLRPVRPLAPLIERVSGIPTSVDYGAAGRWVFVSDFVRRRAGEVGNVLPDTAVAHSGIDTAFLDGSPPPEWGGRLLHVGRLHPDKGIHDAVAALADLPGCTLTFAGSWDAREEQALTDRIRALGLDDRVRMLGQCPPEEVRRLYAEHDAVLFPVRWEEPWGLVPLEAMAAGRPVVATGRGGSAAACTSAPASACTSPAAEPTSRATASSSAAATAPRSRAKGASRSAPARTSPTTC